MGVMAEEGDGMTINAPRTAEETGIRRKVLEDLTLKTMYLMGELSLHDLAEHLRLSLRIVDDAFQRLRKDQLCQVTGMAGAVHRVVLTAEGKGRALEALAINQYVGPLPVSLVDYVNQVRAQTVRRMDVTPPAVQKAFEDLVLDPQVLRQLGSALVSGKAVFLYGPSGTGKTTVAETLSCLFEQENVWIPHAVEHDGQIITIYDPLTHKQVDDPFLRRIQTKIRLGSVTREHFHEICRRVCAQNKLHYDTGLIEELIDTIATDLGQDLRPCYPRDIINQVCWAARYESRPAQIDRDSLSQACRTYFISPS